MQRMFSMPLSAVQAFAAAGMHHHQYFHQLQVGHTAPAMHRCAEDNAHAHKSD